MVCSERKVLSVISQTKEASVGPVPSLPRDPRSQDLGQPALSMNDYRYQLSHTHTVLFF
jgi:hypothetical protein